MPLPKSPKPSVGGLLTVRLTCSQFSFLQLLQLIGEALRFRAPHLRIPDRIGAGRKALQAFFDAAQRARVVALVFVRRIEQHQRAARRRRQQRENAVEAVARIEHRAAARVAEIVAQHVDFGGVQLEQAHAVLFAHLPPRDIRRAGIEAQLAVRIERARLRRRSRRTSTAGRCAPTVWRCRSGTRRFWSRSLPSANRRRRPRACRYTSRLCPSGRGSAVAATRRRVSERRRDCLHERRGGS